MTSSNRSNQVKQITTEKIFQAILNDCQKDPASFADMTAFYKHCADIRRVEKVLRKRQYQKYLHYQKESFEILMLDPILLKENIKAEKAYLKEVIMSHRNKGKSESEAQRKVQKILDEMVTTPREGLHHYLTQLFRVTDQPGKNMDELYQSYFVIQAIEKRFKVIWQQDQEMKRKAADAHFNLKKLANETADNLYDRGLKAIMSLKEYRSPEEQTTLLETLKLLTSAIRESAVGYFHVHDAKLAENYSALLTKFIEYQENLRLEKDVANLREQALGTNLVLQKFDQNEHAERVRTIATLVDQVRRDKKTDALENYIDNILSQQLRAYQEAQEKCLVSTRSIFSLFPLAKISKPEKFDEANVELQRLMSDGSEESAENTGLQIIPGYF